MSGEFDFAATAAIRKVAEDWAVLRDSGRWEEFACSPPRLTAETLYTTVSCSYPPRIRNSRLPYHCGYCYPCLVRRSGLWHALGADRSGYQHDPWLLPTRDTKSADLAELLLWLSTPLTTTGLIADLPLPSEISPSDLMPVQHRARRELSAMLTSMLPEEEPRRTGWQPFP